MRHLSVTSNRIRKATKNSLAFGLALMTLVFVTTSQVGALAYLARTDVTQPPFSTQLRHIFASATFSVVPHEAFIITPTASLHGSIAPAAPQTVNLGANQYFTITPDIYYAISDVGVDGASHGPIHYYTFDNVTTDHTITATFANYNVTLTVITDGTGSGIVTPATGSYQHLAGDIVTLTATASADSLFKGWYVLKFVVTTNPLTFTMQTDETLTAVFLLKRNVYLPLVFK
jgi:hypothetical protein